MDNNPSITLRRGKVEIKIENAAAIIKKINETRPTDNTNTNKIDREIRDLERDLQKMWMVSARDWFKKEMFGGDEDFEVIVSETGNKTAEQRSEMPFPNVTFTERHGPPSEPQVIQSVNKNAYEIRTDILAMALDWSKWQAEKTPEAAFRDSDGVLEIAKKFYSFVENRR